MSRQTVIFPDPMLAVLTVIRPLMPATTFGTLKPEDMPTTPVPYVMVRLDGSFAQYPVNETATIRVSVWHRTENEGYMLAQYVRAALLGYLGGAEIRSISPLTGVFPTNDPDTGSPLSYFTVAVRLRPITL